MEKNIWIMNHYATSMYKDQGGRHYWFAENLIKEGYKPTIFCANTFHNSPDYIDTNSNKYKMDILNNIPFVFVKTTTAVGNGLDRVKNMVLFYKNLLKVAKMFSKQEGKPDVILASSVHPLTMVAGIQIAKKFKIPCICEVRDLWPESIVAYGILKKDSILAKILYQGEKWIYKRADSIIMTWEGGRQYIKEQGWDKEIDLEKVNHINNGVILNIFDKNIENYQINDLDLVNPNIKNIIYTGSIRKVNNLGLILDTAKIIQDKGYDDIKFLIYGSGDEVDFLKERLEKEEINNLEFKGRVEKKYVPSILNKAYINLLHNSSTSLDKYGQSQNKFFEYMAAGKCIVQTYTTGYSILDKYKCGISAKEQTTEEIANLLIEACKNEDECREMGKRARQASYDFDFSVHTQRLIDIIESL